MSSYSSNGSLEEWLKTRNARIIIAAVIVLVAGIVWYSYANWDEGPSLPQNPADSAQRCTGDDTDVCAPDGGDDEFIE